MPDLFGIDHTQGFDAETFLARTNDLAQAIPDEPAPLSKKPAKRVLTAVNDLIDRLTDLARALDPVTHPDVYDPSHPEAAADLIAEKLERRDPLPLDGLAPFWGSGIYAIYYTGDHPAYEIISGLPLPIYVGKADPRVRTAVTAQQQGMKLHGRLGEHARNIRLTQEYVSGLTEAHRAEAGLYPMRLQDFECRYLVLASAFAGAVEDALLGYHQPVWNEVCIGFGKHGDEAKTRGNTRSDWDTLHPGRKWALRPENKDNPRSPRDIQASILAHSRRYIR